MNLQPKPTLVNVIAWTTLASGVVNLFWGIFASHTALATVVGIFCVPITILPTILGVFELIYAAKLFSNPPQEVKPATNIAVLEIACVVTGNVFSMAVGILSLVFYNDSVVRDYFARLNGLLPPAPPVASASVNQPQPAPELDEAATPPAEDSDLQPPEEPSAKPKRTPRKNAE